MPSVFIHVPSPFFFKWSTASEREGWGRLKEEGRRRVRERGEHFPLEMRRVEVDSSAVQRLSLLSSKHSAMQNSQKPPKPVLWLHFEHQGNSFTSRSGSFKLYPVFKITPEDQEMDVPFLFAKRACQYTVHSAYTPYLFVSERHKGRVWTVRCKNTHSHNTRTHMVLIMWRTAAGVWKSWENGSWNQANQLPLQPAPVCLYLLLTISQ